MSRNRGSPARVVAIDSAGWMEQLGLDGDNSAPPSPASRAERRDVVSSLGGSQRSRARSKAGVDLSATYPPPKPVSTSASRDAPPRQQQQPPQGRVGRRRSSVLGAIRARRRSSLVSGLRNLRSRMSFSRKQSLTHMRTSGRRLSVIAVQGTKVPLWTLPNSTERRYWDALLALSVVWISFSTPVLASFWWGQAGWALGLELVFDLLFMADMFLRYRYFALDLNGNVVYERDQLAAHYRSTWLPWDLLSCFSLPVSLVLLALGRYHPVASLPRWLRTLRLRLYADRAETVVRERFVDFSVPGARMYKIGFALAVLSNFFASIYYYAACPESECRGDGWVEQAGLGDKPALEAYLWANYVFFQVLFTVGYGDLNPATAEETTLQVFFMLTGAVMYALVIANMTSVIVNLDVTTTRFKRKMDMVSEFSDSYLLPASIRAHILKHFTFLNARQHGRRTTKIVSRLPPSLRDALADENGGLLGETHFFSHPLRETTFRALVVRSLQPRTFGAGDMLAHNDTVSTEMVLVRTGTVSVLHRQLNTTVGKMGPGSVFGEYELLFGTPHRFSLRAMVWCDVEVLSHAALHGILTDPRFRHYGAMIHNAALAQHLVWSKPPYPKPRGVRTSSTARLDAGLAACIRAHEDFSRAFLLRPPPLARSSGARRKSLMNRILAQDEHQSPWRRNSRARHAWDAVLLVAVLWTAFFVPLRVALHPREWQSSLVVDYLCDVVFVLDIVGRYHYFGYVSIESGEATAMDVLEPDQIRQQYRASGWFEVDVLTSVSIDLLGFWTGYWPLLRLVRLGKCGRLFSYMYGLKDDLEFYNVTVPIDVLTVVNWICLTVLFAHWASCGWIMLHSGASYLNAIYWTLTTITTVGFGDITPQRVADVAMTLAAIALGTTMFAGVVANIAVLVHTVEISPDNFEHQVEVVEHYLVRRQIPAPIAKRCRAFLAYKREIHGGASWNRMLSELLPTVCAREVRLQQVLPFVEACPAFAGNTSEGLRRSLCALMEEHLFCADDFVVPPGSLPALCIVRDGRVAVSLRTAASLAPLRFTVSPPNSFAEHFIHDTTDEVEAVAVTNVTLLRLTRPALESVLQHYPLEAGDVHAAADEAVAARLRRRGAVGDHRRASVTQQLLQQLQEARNNSLLTPVAKQRWSLVVSLFALYNATIIPLRVAFAYGLGLSYWMLLDFASDLLLIADVLARAFIPGFDSKLAVTLTRGERLRGYLRGKGVFDLLAALPFDFLYFALRPAAEGALSDMQLLALLRCGKLLRLVRLREYTAELQSRVTVNDNTATFCKLVALLLSAAHWIGCCWYFLALQTHPEPTWAQAAGVLPSCYTATSADKRACELDVAEVAEQYVKSVYWATATLTTVGYGDISPVSEAEVTMSVVVLIVGTLIYTIIIAHLEIIVAQIDATSALWQQQLDETKLYMAERELPQELQTRVLSHFYSSWERSKGVKEERLLRFLSPELRLALLMHAAVPLFQRLPLLHDCPPPLLRDLANVLAPDVFQAGDLIYEEGQCASKLYLLAEGEVELSSTSEAGLASRSLSSTRLTELSGKARGCVALQIMRAPCALGAEKFFVQALHITVARAKTYCVAYMLRHGEMTDVLDRHPEYQRQFHKDRLDMELVLRSGRSIARYVRNLESTKVFGMMCVDDPGTRDSVVKKKKHGLDNWVVLPTSTPRHAWGVLLLAVLVANLTMLPYRVAFLSDEESNAGSWVVIDSLLDIALFIDMWLNWRHFAMLTEGGTVLVTQPQEFGPLYRSGPLRWDLLTALPLHLVVAAAGERRVGVLSAMRVLRMGLLRRAPELLGYLVALVETYVARFKTGLWRVFGLLAVIVLAAHWFACAFFLIARVEGVSGADTWTAAAGVDEASSSVQYATSMYWAMYTLSTVGFGNVVPVSVAEHLFAIGAMVCGAVLSDAGVTAILTTLIDTMDAQAGSKKRDADCLGAYVKYRKFEGDLAQRLEFYLNHLRSTTPLHEQRVLDDNLPRQLRTAVLMALNLEDIRRLPLAAKFPHGFVRSLVTRMRPYKAMPSEVLVKAGEQSLAVFRLHTGRCQLEQADGLKQSIFDGSVFGSFQRALATVRALTVCDLFVLRHSDYQSCLEFQRNASTRARRRAGALSSVEQSVDSALQKFSNNHVGSLEIGGGGKARTRVKISRP